MNTAIREWTNTLTTTVVFVLALVLSYSVLG